MIETEEKDTQKYVGEKIFTLEQSNIMSGCLWQNMIENPEKSGKDWQGTFGVEV